MGFVVACAGDMWVTQAACFQHEGGGSCEAVGSGDEAVPSVPAGERAAGGVRALRLQGQGERGAGRGSIGVLEELCLPPPAHSPLVVLWAQRGASRCLPPWFSNDRRNWGTCVTRCRRSLGPSVRQKSSLLLFQVTNKTCSYWELLAGFKFWQSGKE